MSYMRGAHYLWSDGERIHLWSAEGYDGWDHSGWAEGHGAEEPDPERRIPGPSGVCLPEAVADEYVLMRLAELVREGGAVAALDRAVARHGGPEGNGGAGALGELAPALRAALAGLASCPGAA